MACADCTVFEQFVSLTDSLWWFADKHPYLGTAISAASVLGNWAIFRYHYAALLESRFLITNIQIAGRFSKPTYDMWKYVAMSVMPFGMTVVLFTLFTRAQSLPFLAAFGIKGSGSVKRRLVRNALDNRPLARYLRVLLQRMESL